MLIWDNVYSKYKLGKGKTLFARKEIKKDEIVMVISGPVVTEPTIYTIPIDNNLFIDPVPMNNPARYLCHDCEPNAGIRDRTLLVAIRDIAKDEEVAIDYAMIVEDYRSEMTPENRVCHCGKPTCRGVLGSWNDLPWGLRKQYFGYISDFLINKAVITESSNEDKAA